MSEGCHIEIVFSGSCSTQGVENKYSLTEGEALAISWSLNQAKYFVLGCPNL